MNAKQLQNYCNSLGSGYLKEHKAYTILATLHDIPEIKSDCARMMNYMCTVLQMEGFSEVDAEKINAWIIKNDL